MVNDLLDTIDQRYRTRKSAANRAIAGVSMGGFGAMSLGLRYPDKFSAAVSLSGALFDAAPTHRKVYLKVWGSPPDPAYFASTSPLALMQKLPERSRRTAMYLHCGDRDSLGFLKYAIQAHQVLRQRKIRHAFRVSGGGHTWDVWNAQAEDWLRWTIDQLARAARRK